MSGLSGAAPRTVRVMVVEDSAVVQGLLRFIIGADPRLEVCAVCTSGEAAIEALPRVRPDVISMDIRLPGMDGLEATRLIMSRFPTPIVVIANAVEDASLRISMNSLRSGALSVVEKPAGFGHAHHAEIAETIRTQLYIMSQVPVIRQRPMPDREAGSHHRVASRAGRRITPTIAGLVASTGGPAALARVLGALPEDFPAPILVVQHMGAAFMPGFAAWLDGLVPMQVAIAEHGRTPMPGHVYIAPGDEHLTLGLDGTLRLGREAQVSSQRPSGTVLFRSLATLCGPRAMGVLMTGMGEDGAEGLFAMRRAGALTLTEDETTTVVYGMPQAAVKIGASRLSLPLDRIPDAIRRAFMEGASW
ncbi:MAG TPA: chemotaxis-specific protein-glutamate methyltransferase CheB [Acidisoma sp.]|nr:chemotaxis-specific protein-glutamate methyltransferase CheB [Acidisoma sp.]